MGSFYCTRALVDTIFMKEYVVEKWNTMLELLLMERERPIFD
jgi:hypothetical protein